MATRPLRSINCTFLHLPKAFFAAQHNHLTEEAASSYSGCAKARQKKPSHSVAKAGCPTSRSFFARCGIPPMLTAKWIGESRVRGKVAWYPTSREKRARCGGTRPWRRNQRAPDMVAFQRFPQPDLSESFGEAMPTFQFQGSSPLNLRRQTASSCRAYIPGKS